MNDQEDTTRKFDDQPEWVRYLISRVDGLTSEVSQLRDRLDARDRETKPLNETLEAFRIEIRELREGQDSLQRGQEDLRKGQEDLRRGQEDLRADFGQFREEVRVEFRRLNAKILDVLQRHMDVVADISELNRRVSALEAPNN
jgi:chromosome segregation ATPase